MYFSFDTDIACEIGVNEAIFLNNMYFWLKKNIANGINFHDGRYWTYNSTVAFTRLFPFWSERQINYIIKKLIDNGYLITGNYNKNKMDRSKWYSLTDKGWLLFEKNHQNMEPDSETKPEENEEIPEQKCSNAFDKIVKSTEQNSSFYLTKLSNLNTDNKTTDIKTQINNKNILSGYPDDEEKPVEVVEAEVISDGRIVQPKKKSISESIVEIVEYLNEKAGTHYRSTTPKTQRLIKARLAEGFTVDDFRTVINKKCADWLGDGDMVQYLRPDTLFSTKFEGYLNQREADYTKMKPILTKQDKLILQDRMRCKREERDSSEIDREFAKLFSRGGL